MLSPEAPVAGAVSVTAADFQAMMARRTGKTPASKSKPKSSRSSAAGGGGTLSTQDVMDAEDTTEEEKKILAAEDLVRELDSLLNEKEKLEKEVKRERRALIAKIGGSEELAALEAGAASDAANTERILSSKPVFFTETGEEDETPLSPSPADGGGSSGNGNDAVAKGGALVPSTRSPNSADSALGGSGKIDYLQRNIDLAADGAAGALAMTAEERARIAFLVGGPDSEDNNAANDEDGGDEEGNENPFLIPGEEGNVSGFTFEADAELRLQEIEARLADFGGLMALMAAHESSESADAAAEDSLASPSEPAATTSSAAASPPKTDSGAAEIEKQERLAHIDSELARMNEEYEALAEEPAVALDSNVLKQLLSAAQHEQQLAADGAFPGAVPATAAAEAAAASSMQEPEQKPEEAGAQGEEARIISAAEAAGLSTTAPGKKKVFF